MKKDYMARLERAARWRLPPQEAEDVIADYRDIVGTPPRSEDELRRELGKPRNVIRPLIQKKPYYTWLAVYVALAACVYLLGHTGFGFYSWEFYRLCFELGHFHLGPVFALLGMALALVWFRRRRDEPKSPVPKGIIITLAVLLVWIGLVFLFNWAVLCAKDDFFAMWGMMEPLIGPRGHLVYRSMHLSTWAMCLLPFFVSYTALYWLVKARVRDRRWAAAYVLALTAIVITMETVALVTSMDPTLFIEIGLRANLPKCAVITVIGLIGTGVALC
ncbi:MAG: hypothetical protein K2M42_03765 [Oscillospiraceae bacterium]|nr:hypothetical protein [Oscillospiraceae bacterium]